MRVPPFPAEGGEGVGVKGGGAGSSWFMSGQPAGRPEPLPEGFAEAPAGPELAALLDQVGLAQVSGHDTVEVLTAAYRQACHYRAVFLLGLLETGLRRPGSSDAVSRVAVPGEFAGEEARAALVWSRRRTDSAFNLAWAVFRRLPMIGEAMLAGELDEPRAAALVAWTAQLTDEHADDVCRTVLPRAAELTVGALVDEVKRLAVALDPEWAERTYRASVRERDVVGVRNPSGTVDVTGRNLPVDRAAAGCDRIGELARRCKRAGDRRPIAQIRADLFLGMLDGTFAEFTDEQIIAFLCRHADDAEPCAAPDDLPPTDDPDAGGSSGGDGPDSGGPGGGASGGGPGGGVSGGDPGGAASGGCADADASGAGVSGAGTPDAGAPGSDAPDPDISGPDNSGPHISAAGDVAGSAGGGRWSVRELRVQLATLLGANEQPAELPGWGFVPAATARRLAAEMRAAQWRYVVCDGDGRPIDVGLLRRRPGARTVGAGPRSPRRPGVVEIAVYAAELERFADEAASGSRDLWRAVIDEITQARTSPAADRGAADGVIGHAGKRRFADARLRRWILTRDRACTHPSCRVPAAKTDLDHTVDYAHGGATTGANLGGRCRHDHRVKHEGGWEIVQVSSEVTVWISPLGHRYENRPPPVIPPRVRSARAPTSDSSGDLLVPLSRVRSAVCRCGDGATCPECVPILPPPRSLRVPVGSDGEDCDDDRDGIVSAPPAFLAGQEGAHVGGDGRPSLHDLEQAAREKDFRRLVGLQRQRDWRPRARLPEPWASGFPPPAIGASFVDTLLHRHLSIKNLARIDESGDPATSVHMCGGISDASAGCQC